MCKIIYWYISVINVNKNKKYGVYEKCNWFWYKIIKGENGNRKCKTADSVDCTLR